MRFILSFSCLAALSFVGAQYAPSAPPPIRVPYHYLTDNVGITWYDPDYDRLIRWVHWRNVTVPGPQHQVYLQYLPVPTVPQATRPESKTPRNRRRYGPGPHDWEYDSLP